MGLSLRMALRTSAIVAGYASQCIRKGSPHCGPTAVYREYPPSAVYREYPPTAVYREYPPSAVPTERRLLKAAALVAGKAVSRLKTPK